MSAEVHSQWDVLVFGELGFVKANELDVRFVTHQENKAKNLCNAHITWTSHGDLRKCGQWR